MTAVATPPIVPASAPGRSTGRRRLALPPLAARRPRRPRRPAAPRRTAPPSETLSVLSSGGTMLALICLWMLAQLLWLGGLSEHRAQANLYQEFRRQVAETTAPTGPVIPPGDPVALLSNARLGQVVVVEGTASGDLLSGPGHLRNTVLPGQEGFSEVMGRGTTYGAPFEYLTELQPGDDITAVTAQGEKHFRVLGVRRAGDPVPTIAPGRAFLTLATGVGTGRLSSLTASQVVYVDAVAKKAFPAPAGRPLVVPESEKEMARDPAALPLLVLCLALVLAVALGVVVASQRWSTVLVWVIASPVALAVAWFTTDVVMRLLPNLI